MSLRGLWKRTGQFSSFFLTDLHRGQESLCLSLKGFLCPYFLPKCSCVFHVVGLGQTPSSVLTQGSPQHLHLPEGKT